MLVRARDVPEVAEPSNHVVMRALVRAADHGPDLSMTWVRLSGRHRALRTERSTRVYYLLGGSGRFEVGDDPPFDADAGDVVVVPRGVRYAFEGEMTYLVVNGPAFHEGDDVYED